MTDTEDELYTRLAGSAKILAIWQSMGVLNCVFLATSGHPLFWWPAGVTGIAFALTLAELLWYIPRMRRRAWLRGWRVGDACEIELAPNPAYADAPFETSCFRYDIATGDVVVGMAFSEDELRQFFSEQEKQIDTDNQTS